MSALSREELIELLAIQQELERRASAKDISKWFPEDGKYSRHAYPKHMAFFKAGAEHRERCFLAANRVGKTIAGGFEVALHQTGLYPAWWEGWRIDRAPRTWCAGKTTETVRDIMQLALFGPASAFGTGMIPRHLIGDIKYRPNTNGCLDFANIKHEPSGTWGQIGFKTYIQGRDAYEGTERELVWGDEEMPVDIYSECVTRTATTDGRLMLTFTPLEGVTPLVIEFIEKAVYRV